MRSPHSFLCLRSRRAFTLVELIAASVIMAMIAGGTAIALSRSAKSRDAAVGRYEAFSRAASAVETIARDLQNVVREADLTHAKVALSPGGSDGARRDQLIVVSENLRPVRPGSEQAEAPTAEVQYKVMEEEALASPTGEARTTNVLWRRIDPVPDVYPDAGGVATPLIPGIVSLSFEASDGFEWYPDWDSDFDGYPHMIRVTVVAQADDGSRTAVARRTIAIDRTPLPGSAAAPVETTDPSAQPGATPSQPTTTPNTGGNQNGGGTIVRPGTGRPGGGQPGGGRPGGGRPGGGRPGGQPGGGQPGGLPPPGGGIGRPMGGGG